ncbi:MULTISPECIES: 4-hydroxybenzoate 3-monooxygenase [Streptacidiphilus]|uniref:4-hydroxybenzoate 3-monooxygenase n=1 Tax=Streptacidiphilus cavernicola TaxID=3342716 RepID=A0ABV6UI38_9ACTN|nr:4-hydroxybenzoate 3-monooxygenase [Streptacidiphilus jeojiense]
MVRERTAVVIVGGGPAGLTLAALLRRCEVPCVVLEVRNREHIEKRQRAGIVEYQAARMLDGWGLADRLLGDAPVGGRLELRVDGVPHQLGDDAIGGIMCPQQVLVRNLIELLLEEGVDLRFGAAEVTLHGLTGERPTVRYRDAEGLEHEIACDFVAGCDGFHGAGRAAVPAGAVRVLGHDYGGASWLTVLADAPPYRHPLMAVSDRGFAAQFARGPAASRFYLQCAPGDTEQDWPDERIWEQLRVRLGDPGLRAAAVTESEVFAHRGVVHDPMSHGRLFLVGDAAHIISPLGGKGMNLALHDADVLARALRGFTRDGDESGLRDYSRDCLPRVWACQEFCDWLMETTHAAGDTSPSAAYRRGMARARLARLTGSDTSARLYAEQMAGLA